eukprot:CAMPEP_0185578042 /NCGR_PEP_ID=MMETSP0434-20130131/11800_1 /TAXON_ID=626734 ORGANISM="Favella taraikaensis, Strain Fe Narragansett Bay" /NCGR_SAMPLE_ID=MMETSP0434 /ASSEMBLY_ACC=CAM_ASM_000379 /LENGTH=180 /DNA_ID=CAMNT_0028195757 /DNA_START=14 /DNA_END=556 /DNA_ORIENTATION=+
MSLDYIRVTLPALYPYVMLAAGTISFQCLLIGFGAGGKRGEYFTKNEQIKEKYNEEHQKNFKTDVPKGGYPDHGDGLYGDLLSYEQWYNFSLDQRGHKNFLEQVTIIVFCLMTIGLVFPIVSLVCAGIHFVCRWIFVCGYKKGPNWRLIGGLPLNVTTIVMLVMSIVSASIFIGNIPKVE